MMMRPVVITKRNDHPFRQPPIHQLTIDHPDLAHVCGHMFDDNRICVLTEPQHVPPPPRDAERVRLAGFALSLIASTDDVAAIHTVAKNALRMMGELR